VAGKNILLDLVEQMTEVRMMIPNIAIVPSKATKPKGMWSSSNAITTPINPSGAVRMT